MDSKTIDNFYFSRFIDSLELDVDKWVMIGMGGCDGSSWNEFHGPEYKNEQNERIQFAFTLNDTGAYVNGYMSWNIPFLNPFSSTCRRFIKSSRKMKKITFKKAEAEYNQKLLKAL